MHSQQHFVGLQSTQLERFARDSSFPIYFRIYLAALARTNRHGHAVFMTGELRDAAGKLDSQSGELTRLGAPAISKGLRRLKQLGLIREESTPKCVWLTSLGYKYETGAIAARCQHHRHLD